MEEYKQKSKNANTTKATTQWMRVFCQWAQKRDHPKNIEILAPDTLDSILQHFVTEINKKDGKDYELLLWRQCKVQLTDIYVSQIMNILY